VAGYGKSARRKVAFLVNPFTGNPTDVFSRWRGTWDQQCSRPEKFTTFFDEENVLFRLAPAQRGAVASFLFEKAGTHAIVLRPRFKDGKFSYENGVLKGRDFYRGMEVFLHAELSSLPLSVRSQGNAMALFFAEDAGNEVILRYAVSYQFQEMAEFSFRKEVSGKSIDELARNAREC
jgi:hypothetical protein